MTKYRNSAEGGVDGVAITPANSAGVSGDPWSAVVLGTGSTAVYDNAQVMHGGMANLISPATSQNAYLRRDVEASVIQVLASFYVRLPSAPSVEVSLATIRNATAEIAAVQVGASPFRFRIYSAAGFLTQTATILANTWYRVELRAVRGTTTGNGTLEFAYYLGDSLTPVEAAFSTAVTNTGIVDLTTTRFGRPGAGADATAHWIDSVQVHTAADAAALGLPWSQTATPSVISAEFEAELALDAVFAQPTPTIQADLTFSLAIEAVFAAPPDPPELAADFTFSLGLEVTFVGALVVEEIPPDTVALELGDDVLVLDAIDAGYQCTALNLGWPEIRPVVAPRPRADGTLDTTEHFGARAVTLDVAILESDGRSWKQALARLGQFLRADRRPTLRLTVDGDDYRMTVAPDLAAAPFDRPHHANVQLAFRAPDPFLYTAGHVVSTTSHRPPTNGRVYPWTPPRQYPVSDAVAGIVEILNAGTATAWPTVDVWGPLSTSFILENQTTGETFSMGATTVEGDHRLEIDMHERTVRYDGNPELPRFSFVNFADSTWLRLVPGVNVIRFSTSHPYTGLASIHWADPFLWPGGITP
jgi:hypothetical protein